ncbi:MAG: 3-isopropylmalate dehydratase large subunit [Treponema sp.]|jgi:3-isopropylmalate/(R)-2-methylmalate dehydratase large subunit|nr:3-isopropylmalate dehydratase large subunit [Treponema sp.]
MGKTLTEKVFEAHEVDRPFEDTWVLRIDRVLCHEITTPIAVNDLASRGLDRVFDPAKIKAVIDHVTPAKDSKSAAQGKTLRDWARRQHIADFFDIGRNGVCHALFPEKGFIHPGFTVIMGDSHTCTHGAFGAFAAGVGTTDLEVGILKGVCAFRRPDTYRVNLNGALKGAASAKDLILGVIAKTGVAGATGMVMEFRGPAAEALSMEGRMTVCNMAVEAGATSGVCMPDGVTVDYLLGLGTWDLGLDHGAEAGGRIGNEASDARARALADFARWGSDADAVYAKTLDFDCSRLEPLVTVGYKPDQVTTVRELAGTKVDQVYIGSCTNGRIEDLRAAAAILKGRSIAPTVRGIVSPATTAVYRQALSEGLLRVFLDAGFCVTNATCGACLGMSNGVLAEGEVCASTTNRNFYGRMGKGGMVHLLSPASAAAAAVTGVITSPEEFL